MPLAWAKNGFDYSPERALPDKPRKSGSACLGSEAGGKVVTPGGQAQPKFLF